MATQNCYGLATDTGHFVFDVIVQNKFFGRWAQILLSWVFKLTVDCLLFFCRRRISLYIWSTRHALMEKCKISRYITHIHRRQNCWKNSLGLQTIFWVVKKFIDAWMRQNGPVVCIHNYDIYIYIIYTYCKLQLFMVKFKSRLMALEGFSII